MYLFTWYIYWKTVLCSQKMRTHSTNYVIFMCSAVLRNHLEASLAIWVYRIGPLAITQRFILWNIFLGFFLNTSNFSFGLGLLDSVLFSFVFSLTPKFLSYTIFFLHLSEGEGKWGVTKSQSNFSCFSSLMWLALCIPFISQFLVFSG